MNKAVFVVTAAALVGLYLAPFLARHLAVDAIFVGGFAAGFVFFGLIVMCWPQR